MKKLLFFFLTVVSCNCISGQRVFDGIYAGLEKICWKTSKTGECNNDDNERPGGKWYHLNLLKINGDSCFLDQSPVIIHKKDTVYSASDGGFMYYTGKVIRTDSTITFNLTELFCHYCGELRQKQADGTYKRIKRTKSYTGKLTDSGIVINNSLYTKADYNEYLVSERPPAAYLVDEAPYQPVKLIRPKHGKRSKKRNKKS